MGCFQNSIRKTWSVCTKIALIEKICWKKQFADIFFVFVYVSIYPLSKFWGNRTNTLWVLALYSVRFKWKNWFEKTALNVSIRRVIFTSGLYLKPPFLCQYLIFFIDFFFILEISFGSLLKPQNRNLNKNCRSEGIR